MSSVFSEHQALQDQLVKPATRRADVASTGLLRAEIPVCVTLSQDPTDRWNLACLNLRWLISESSTTPMRQGAILSLLSLHSDNMRAHATLAARSADAAITVLEVDAIDMTDSTITFNARSGVSERRSTQLMAIAKDLPRSCSNDSPFKDDTIEDRDPLDLSETIDRLQGIAAQIWIAAIKSMTAPDTAAESEGKRLAKYQQQGRLVRQVLVHDAVRAEFLRVIRGSLVLRQFMVSECKRAASMGSETSRYYAMVGDISLYIKNAGLTAFFLTLRFGIGTHYPTLAMSVFSGELKKMSSLIRLYKSKGENAAYMAFLEDADMGNFAPANFSTLYSYAMGVGTVLEASVAKYQFAREFTSETYFRLGVETAQNQQCALDEKTAKEMGLTDEARKQVQALASNIEQGQHSMPMQQQPTFMSQPYQDDDRDQPSTSRPEPRPSQLTSQSAAQDNDAASLDW
ncbi:nucleocapsid protein [avian paramyxovirus 2]|uniref:Nucleocapsid n=1 Tax=avian paramyxovirus 2 TaxID=2560313 RepID=D9ZNL1_9MONO|nr:nucleocapsid protein [Avian metaavulavirus 2]